MLFRVIVELSCVGRKTPSEVRNILGEEGTTRCTHITYFAGGVQRQETYVWVNFMQPFRPMFIWERGMRAARRLRRSDFRNPSWGIVLSIPSMITVLREGVKRCPCSNVPDINSKDPMEFLFQPGNPLGRFGVMNICGECGSSSHPTAPFMWSTDSLRPETIPATGACSITLRLMSG